MISSPWQKPFRGIQINKTHPLSKGLVGCWVMTEGTGDKIFDFSGNGNHGTNEGADWVPDGLNFNSSTDKIVITQNNTIELQTITIKATVTITAADTYHVIVDKPYTSHEDPYYSYHFRINNQNQLFFVVVPTEYANKNEVFGSHTFTIGQSYDVVATFDGTVANLYVDGILIANNSNSVTISYHNTDLDIGHFNNIVSNTNLQIKNTFVYDRALSVEEVAWLNREPYAMFQQPISPATLYYEAPVGVTMPLFIHHQNQLRA